MTDALRVPGQIHRSTPSFPSRPISRASQRPLSRQSHHSVTKQPRLVSLLGTLVKQVLHFSDSENAEDAGHLQYALDVAIKNIDPTRQPTIIADSEMDEKIVGHIMKARINAHDSLAKALQKTYKLLKLSVSDKKRGDSEISFEALPAHMQFLFLLSTPCTPNTLQVAEDVLNRKPPQIQTHADLLKQILQEEPLEFEIWEDGGSNSEISSEISDWGMGQEQRDEHSIDHPSPNDNSHAASITTDFYSLSRHDISSSFEDLMHSNSKGITGRSIVENLHKRQYWRPPWKPEPPAVPFDLRDPSSFGSTFDNLDVNSLFTPKDKIYFSEMDAIREILMRLQGNDSYLFKTTKNTRLIQPHETRRIAHLTLSAQNSLLSWFTIRISTVDYLRRLVRDGFENKHINHTKTSMAFMAAVSSQLCHFDGWCSNLEAEICSAYLGITTHPVVYSLLSLKRLVDECMAGIYDELQKIVQYIETVSMIGHNASTTSAAILNLLWASIQKRIALNDIKTADALLSVWRITGEPTWINLNRWLKDGVPVYVGFEDHGEHPTQIPTWDKDEFFIRVNPLINSNSPEFWEAGYTLPHYDKDIATTDQRNARYPLFLWSFAQDILAAGKAVGLLRGIGFLNTTEEDWLVGWKTLREATAFLSLQALDRTLSDALSQILRPPCEHVQGLLHNVLVKECQFWKYLHSVEYICLMNRGDALSIFCEKLFNRMDSGATWNDFHFMNTSFRQVAIIGQVSWIDPSAITLTYHGSNDRNPARTTHALNGLSINYSVPFPLTYLFGAEIITAYSSIFVFLLQIQRAKSTLDRTSLRRLPPVTKNNHAIFVIRNKLVWFTTTIWNFMMTNVIQVCLTDFHEALRDAGSLDKMIYCHQSHLDKLLRRCLLQSKTAALHTAILSVFDLCLQFHEWFLAFVSKQSIDIAPHSLALTRERRRKRRKYKPDMIGFSDTRPLESDSDGYGDSSAEDHDEVLSSMYASKSRNNNGKSSLYRLNEIGQELDGLVRFISHGVDSLARATGESAQIFGMLAFSLEDWK